MATGLAASIESAFDVKAKLVEGHDGIYQVTVEDQLVYTNKGQCSQGFPKERQLLEQIGKSLGVNPKLTTFLEPKVETKEAPSCALPGTNGSAAAFDSLPMIKPEDTGSNCGCGTPDSDKSSGSGCCGSESGNKRKK